MSYSRWSSSVFYTFWCSSDAKYREEEVFEICAEMSFTYGELKEGLDKCIEKFKAQRHCKPLNEVPNGPAKVDFNPVEDYTSEEYEELKGYMQQFMDDVYKAYDTPSQQYKDGKITLGEAFVEEI